MVDDNPLLGFSCMILSLLLFSMMDATVKWLGSSYETAQIMFFRCSVAMIPVLVIVRFRGGFTLLKTDQIKLHALRSILGVFAMAFAFYAFSLMPLAEAISLLHTGPLFMTALTVLLLGEKVGIKRWSAVVFGFIGMLIVIRPGMGSISGDAIYMLIAAFLIACSTITVRMLSLHDDPVCITFYFTLSGIVASVLGLLYQGWQHPPFWDLALFVFIGLCGGLAQFLMTTSYRHVPLGTLAPLKYLTIFFGGLIAYLIWGEIPDLQSMIGISIIVISGIYTLHRDLLRKRQSQHA